MLPTTGVSETDICKICFPSDLVTCATKLSNITDKLIGSEEEDQNAIFQEASAVYAQFYKLFSYVHAADPPKTYCGSLYKGMKENVKNSDARYIYMKLKKLCPQEFTPSWTYFLALNTSP